ncbi:hypothetical protein WJX81_006811 [Elliptochloris bilobata]|uniref:TrmE-type G domain-containing protein n=1 Tax=Elliptochloris bilobata TaxID=381761 RepID=A0AAW1SD17_9CHLO
MSGPNADTALQSLLSHGTALPRPRTATLAKLHNPATGQMLDRGVVLRFPAPASFTGEDVVELHVHGGAAVVRSVLDALTALPGVRLAEPGEFTRRAFELGKMDLTEVEGVADLLAADTAAQQRQALAHASGEHSARLEIWRGEMLSCLAHTEAVIDFGEEEGLAEGVLAGVRPRIAALLSSLEQHLGAGRRGQLVRSGVRVALMGRPNAGKSSLLNALAGRPAAIVAAQPGTTRDALEVALEVGGYKVLVTDTAGVRAAKGEVEAEGVRRALAAAAAADVVAVVADAAAHPPRRSPSAAAVSCRTGEGMDTLLAELRGAVAAAAGGGGAADDAALVTRERHQRHLAAAVAALQRHQEAGPAAELAAEELRSAARELGRLTGAIDTEAVLDSVFSEFCIGK